MAGTIVHLLVAVKLLEKMREGSFCYPYYNIEMSEDYFIAGNICPDGIMARKNYQRSMKLHTHFRDGIPDGEFDKEGNLALFECRMRDFWRGHQTDEYKTPGLYFGYMTHMMTDKKFILEERPKFFENIANIGLTQKDVETFMRFNRETDLVDFKLLCDFPELKRAKEALMSMPSYEIKGMITYEELDESRAWILQHFFEKKHPRQEAVYLKYESMTAFVDKVVMEIIGQKVLYFK